MKKCLSLATIALLLAACSEKPGYEITGTVSTPDMNGNYVYLYEYGQQNAQPIDSAVVTNNTFAFKGTQNGSVLATVQFSTDLVPEKRGQGTPFKTTFTLENGKIVIALDSTASVVTGTPANDAEKLLKDNMKGFIDEIGKLGNDIRSEDKTIAEAAEKKYDEISNKITQAVCNFILDHMDQKISAKYLYDNRYNLSEEQQNDILSKADSVFKAQPNIDKMIERLNILQNVAVGKQFADFEMADAKGNMHKLSEYVGNGKVVLIDFWASWCPPCRKEMPHLVELYKQYKNKGFEIVGISLDSTPEAWAKGVKDLNINWPQLSDLQGWQNAGAALYGVNSIPHTVLVDKDGTIIAKNIHGEEIDAKLQEALKK